MTEREQPIELEMEIASAYAGTFISRWDLYPLQRSDDGSYVCVKKPLSTGMVRSHLTCHWRQTKPFMLGTYALSKDSRAKWLCLDADSDDEFQHVWRLAHQLKAHQVPSYVESSRRGGHLWFFFEIPTLAHEVRAFAKSLPVTYPRSRSTLNRTHWIQVRDHWCACLWVCIRKRAKYIPSLIWTVIP